MRMALGFVVSPLVGISIFLAYILTPVLFGHHLNYSDSAEGISLGLMFAIPIYLLTVIISIPIFLAVRYFYRLLWWTSVIAALAVLSIQAFLFKLLGREEISGLLDINNLIVALLGTMAYGLAFWLIARWSPGSKTVSRET